MTRPLSKYIERDEKLVLSCQLLKQKCHADWCLALDVGAGFLKSRLVIDPDDRLGEDFEFDLPETNADSLVFSSQNIIFNQLTVNFPNDPLVDFFKPESGMVQSVTLDGEKAIGFIVLLFKQPLNHQQVAAFSQDIAMVCLEHSRSLFNDFRVNDIRFYEHAARFAHLGHWHQNLDSKRLHWSDEVFRILDEPVNSFSPDIERFYGYVYRRDQDRLRSAEKQCRLHDIDIGIDIRIITAKWDKKWVRLQGQMKKDQHGRFQQLFGVIQDISEQKRTEKVLSQRSQTDFLTQLPNRFGFTKDLHTAIRRSNKKREPFYLTYLGLDFFKEVNDLHGHDIGDLVLLKVANQLQQLLPKRDKVARLGGDEFAIIHSDKTPIQTLIEQLKQTFAKHHIVNDIHINLSVSMGTAMYPDNAFNADSLMAMADRALFVAKEQGRNRHLYFNQEMKNKVIRRSLLRARLEDSLKHQQGLQLNYQPIVDGHSYEVTKLEALVSWQDEKIGRVNADEFIPLAEETGLINELSSWILQQYARDIRLASEWLPDDFQVNLNLSATELTFETGGIGNVIELLEREPDLAAHIMIEITETALLDESSVIMDNLQRVRERGVQIALDDFGTGFSSLSHCHSYPIDMLKIDKSFLLNYEDSEKSQKIVEGIIFLAKIMNLTVTAEGIESQAIADELRNRVDYMQGYYFAKPMPMNQLVNYLSSYRVAER